MVVGAIQRGGPSNEGREAQQESSQQIIREFIAEATEPDTERFTRTSTRLTSAFKITTPSTNRSIKAKEYVRGDVHTNSIENAWSLFNDR